MKIITLTLLASVLLVLVFQSCRSSQQNNSNITIQENDKRASLIPVIFDTDANNELDDQHALAYLLFNGATFDVRGITTNATHSGGEIDKHTEEAKRIMKLCKADYNIPLHEGANTNFTEIRKHISKEDFDGKSAVDFIIEEARKPRDTKLVLLPVGKLTNIALALEIAPDIKDRVRIVWLGSNYPDPREYNLVNDIPSLTYILDQNVPFEMVVCRYGKSSGSDAVRVTPDEINRNLKGRGIKVSPVEGRHGETFTTFGDYSVNLFDHVTLHGNPPARALFDMVAVAILKNPSWGEAKTIPAPKIIEESWVDQNTSNRKIVIWENFDKESILNDFYSSIKNPDIAKRL